MSDPVPSTTIFYLGVNVQEVHGIIMSIAWFILPNFAIWALHFKSNPYAIYVHIVCMSLSAFLMAVGPIIMLTYYGASIILQFWYHQLIGFILYCILPILLVSGSVCKISKDKPDVEPSMVYFRNKAHSIFGWVYILLIHVPLLTGWYGGITNYIFGFVILVDGISYAIFFALKFKKRIQSTSLNGIVAISQLRTVKTIKDFQIYSENYFIFANYVYSISQILGNHPGGWKIIEAIRAREVDRFIYGVDAIQFYDVPKISHSQNSINLAGQPIAVLKIPLTYTVQELNKVKSISVYCHDRNMTIHTVYLELQGQNKFIGYSDLSQIGQYYSLTVNEKFTRLYTAVNFLQPKNLKLMMHIGKGAIQVKKHYYSNQKQSNMTQQQSTFYSQLKGIEEENGTMNILPLLIKKYSDGRLTSLFLSYNFKMKSIIVSQPRGLGLCLNGINSKNIVIYAGGTGLYPYSDLIDLLFKAKIVEEGHELSNIILESNPILKQKPFKRFNFNIYISVTNTDQFHPVTLYQLNQLSTTDWFACHIKISNEQKKNFAEKYSHFNFISERFEKTVSKLVQKYEDAMFYICGPIRFTKTLVSEFGHQNVPPSRFRIV